MRTAGSQHRGREAVKPPRQVPRARPHRELAISPLTHDRIRPARRWGAVPSSRDQDRARAGRFCRPFGPCQHQYLGRNPRTSLPTWRRWRSARRAPLTDQQPPARRRAPDRTIRGHGTRRNRAERPPSVAIRRLMPFRARAAARVPGAPNLNLGGERNSSGQTPSR